ncbi:MAG: phenylacetic acid degradation protein PaaY [Rhodocyclaceae bacterium]|nr:phenylacetic acid degradation protein PaaY [Rhodocyclaceae bacterium]MBX3666901.1 phenylacetic acid degradation protein PaaY [Rhodocyclaceae bacterium]
MPAYSIEDIVPVVDPTAYVHPAAILIGDVIVGPGCYVGPGASLRGDFGRLIMERGANLQDNCVMHGYPGTDTVIGEDGHVGHGAVLHGCRIGRAALVGINAVIMDEAVVGEEAIVAACAFVKAGMLIPARSLAAGVPAKVVRELSAAEIDWKMGGTRVYQELTRRSLASLRAVEPLARVEPNRRRIVCSEPVLPLSQSKSGNSQ